jgi:Ca-activated chloride channel family protein
MTFANPLAFVLLLALIPMIWFYLRPRHQHFVKLPSGVNVKSIRRRGWTWLRHGPFCLRVAAVLLAIVALARPQDNDTKIKKTTEGLDIVLIIDTSHSMEARDFVLDGQVHTRIQVVKKVIAKFIQDRPSDRIGLVVFGTEAFTQAPLTLDHDVLLRFLDEVHADMVGPATAIGDAIATSVKRLKDLKAKNKLAILLTDGENSAGRIEPLPAAQAANALGVKVYTIGVGNDGPVPVVENGRLVRRQFPINETALKEIAKITNANYFRAKDTETLVNVYDTIDQLEKTKVKVRAFTRSEEKYASFVWPALGLLILELLMGLSRFRRIP